MATINAYRMDGLGNDFIIIDRRKNFIDLSREKIIQLGKDQKLVLIKLYSLKKKKKILFQ